MKKKIKCQFYKKKVPGKNGDDIRDRQKIDETTQILARIAFARDKREGIEYKGSRKEGTETFVIKLHELGKPLSRDLSDEHWKDFFKWKWQWLSHKYTTSNLGTWFPEHKS